jgi:drug/metabolite transporter (DMT)-like permease
VPPLAILLLFLSALLHTTWNFLLKRSTEKNMTTWWLVMVGGATSLVLLLFVGLPPRQIWGFVFFSVLAETVYFLLLSRAYQVNDFSLVYPIARGAAPAFLAIWSFLFLRERPSLAGIAGLALIILGLLVIGASALLQTGLRRVHLSGVWLSLALALVISTYTVIDGAAVKRSPALPYALLIFSLVPLPLTPWMLRQYRWPHLLTVWSEHKVTLVLSGLLGIVAYLLALAAYSIAPLSYSGAVREVSVVLGALIGWLLLGEKFGPLRLSGSLLIFAGILAIAIYG